MPPIDSHPSRLPARAWPLACGLALIVFVVFGSAVRFGFSHWDDPQQVLENPNVNRPSWQGVRASWRAPYWGLYIPVSYSVLAFEAAIAQRVDPVSGLSELRPSVFHLGNLLLHAACTVAGLRAPAAIARTQHRTRSSALPVGDRMSSRRRSVMRTLVAAGLGALLFAVHPLQVESVAWISEVRGLLCGLFALLALWQYVEYADARRSGRVRAMLYAGATAALAPGAAVEAGGRGRSAHGRRAGRRPVAPPAATGARWKFALGRLRGGRDRDYEAASARSRRWLLCRRWRCGR